MYSVIEIGDDTIEDVLCLDKLDNYLRRALDHPGEVALEIFPKISVWGALRQRLTMLAIIPGIGILLMIFGAVIAGFIAVLLGLAVAFMALPAMMALPRYAGVSAVTIDGKRYSNS